MDRVSENELIDLSKIEFKKIFNYEAQLGSIAPGRINIIGEHTDYNLGLAMPQAINRWVCTLISKRDDNNINIYSSAFKKLIATNLDRISSGKENWEKYILGVVKALDDKINIKNGFDLFIGGNISIGAGISSSAALEVSIVLSIYKMINKKIDKIKVLEICNYVEKKYLGINSGMLDQYASLFSRRDKIMIVDFSTLNHEYFKFNIENASWVLVNSMVYRELVTSKYNERVEECKKGLDIINKNKENKKQINEINEIDLSKLESHELYYKRLLHVISENKRVKMMKDAMLSKNVHLIGKLLNESHASLFQNYEVSCDEIESIIRISKEQCGFYGGRIMGGGFGGCTINLVEKSKVNSFIKNVENHFFTKYNCKVAIGCVNFSKGAFTFNN